MQSLRMNTGVVAAMTLAAVSGASAETLPTLLDVLPPQTISSTFDAPDWVTYAAAEYDRVERSLLTEHPRAHSISENVRVFEADAPIAVLTVWDLCASSRAAREVAVVTAPRPGAISPAGQITDDQAGPGHQSFLISSLYHFTNIATAR